jgi:RsiW-degrading membrane proteinase PrsW (M82 family)
VNLFIASAAPLFIAVFLLKGEARRFLSFFLLGLIVCFFSAYINTFFVVQFGMDMGEATIKITPLCEEILKALPIFFYVLVFSPKRSSIISCSVALGLGFALLENANYVLNAVEGGVLFAVVRGFSAGLMHTVSGAILGYGLALVYKSRYIAVPMSLALLCMTATCHSIYNMFVYESGILAIVGYVLPFAVAAAIFSAARGGILDEKTT